jgi:hypothetical protein
MRRVFGREGGLVTVSLLEWDIILEDKQSDGDWKRHQAATKRRLVMQTWQEVGSKARNFYLRMTERASHCAPCRGATRSPSYV